VKKFIQVKDTSGDAMLVSIEDILSVRDMSTAGKPPLTIIVLRNRDHHIEVRTTVESVIGALEEQVCIVKTV
jgi:hypothetical protein